MKSKLFIIMALFMFLFPVAISAQWTAVWDIHQIGDYEEYSATFSGNVMVNGYIDIYQAHELSSITFLIFNKEEYDNFYNTEDNGTYDAIPDFEILDIRFEGIRTWNHSLFMENESVWFFIWLKVAGESDVTYMNVMVDSNPITTTTTDTTTTDTTMTDTTTTTTSGTITIPNGVEDMLFIYVLLGVLGGVGVVVIYMVVRPRKTKYVWDVK